MKRIFILLATAAITAGLYSCGDRTPSPTYVDNGESQIAQSREETFAYTESENVVNDVLKLMSSDNDYGGGSRRADDEGCGFESIDSSGAPGPRKITITYNSTCDGRGRSGQVSFVLSKGNKWGERGAVIDIFYNNYSVRRLIGSASKTYRINGYHTIENVSGGLINRVRLNDTVTHKVRGKLNITFAGGRSRTWQVFRRRTLVSDGNIYRLFANGDTTVTNYTYQGKTTNFIENITGVAMIGTYNYFGSEEEPFYSAIESAVMYNSFCNTRRPILGVKTIYLPTRDRKVRITYGLTPAGATPSPNDILGICPTNYKIEVLNNTGSAKGGIYAY